MPTKLQKQKIGDYQIFNLILIILSFTHVAPIKEKLWLEESQYRKHGENSFQKMGTEL